jgi:hypothetical protein
MEKHLQQILQEVNTIIIPGLGALTVTNHKTGEVMFMPYLKYDDGKLASFIAEKEGISLDDAKALISKDVSEILSTIEAGNGFNLNGVGSFKKDSSGDIDFKSGVYVEASTVVNLSEDVIAIEELLVEETSAKVEEQIIEEPINESVDSTLEEEIVLETDEEVVSEVTPVDNENKKKGFFSMLNKETVIPIETVELEDEEESEIAFEIELPSEEVVEKEEILDIQKEDEISSPIEDKLEVEEISAPEDTIEVEESVDIQGDNSDELGSTQSISENTITDEEFLAEEEVIAPVKKKKGAKFWIFTILIVLLAGGGTFVGLNFDTYKKYLPFGTKTDTIDISEEEKIIETLESDETEPVKEKATKTEEMIHSAPAEEKVVEEVAPEPKVEEPVVQEAPVEKPASEPVHKSKPKAKSYSKVKMEDVQVQSIADGSSYIILGTYAEKVSAVGQVEMLLSKGKKGASVIERDGKFSVSYGTYTSKEEAIAKLEEAKAAFSHAWVLHK